MAERRKTARLETAQHDDGVVVTERREEKEESRFLKEQLYASARYADKKDLIEALLEKGRYYTIEEVDNIIAEYLHGKER